MEERRKADLEITSEYYSIHSLLDMPWRISNELRRQIALPYIRFMFALHGIKWGRNWRIFGMPIIQKHRASSILLGDGLALRSWYSTNPLAPNHPVVFSTRNAGALIEVGVHCGFTGAVIVAAEKIQIGDRVNLGANVIVADTDFHPLDPEQRQANPLAGNHRPVIIEDDVFVGVNAMILKGVRVGRASVVGAGSVVTRDVPPHTIVAGNPARVVRSL